MPCETLATFLPIAIGMEKGAKSCPAEMQEQISQSFFEKDNQNNITPLTVKVGGVFFCDEEASLHNVTSSGVEMCCLEFV